MQGTMSAFMAGVMIGAFILGKLADRLEMLSIILTSIALHTHNLQFNLQLKWY